MIFFSGRTFAASCDSVMTAIQEKESLSEKSKATKTKKMAMDSAAIQKKREYYQANAIYNIKPDPVYGDIFDLPEDIDLLMMDKKHFTQIREYTNANKTLRVFDNLKTKNLQGFSIKSGKNLSIYTFKSDCSVEQATMILEGARCYLKRSDCLDVEPATAAKLKNKCSYFSDFSEKTVKSFGETCDLLTSDFTQSTNRKEKAAERKDKSPGVN